MAQFSGCHILTQESTIVALLLHLQGIGDLPGVGTIHLQTAVLPAIAALPLHVHCVMILRVVSSIPSQLALACTTCDRDGLTGLASLLQQVAMKISFCRFFERRMRSVVLCKHILISFHRYASASVWPLVSSVSSLVESILGSCPESIQCSCLWES